MGKRKRCVETAEPKKKTTTEPKLKIRDVEPRDHAETPMDAYRDVAPILKAAGATTVYDPYYCNGSVIEKLRRLGYSCVNRNRDFYEDVKTGLPPHNFLLTNPPYSSDHIERLVKICVERKVPFALLLPTFVVAKPFWVDAIKRLDPKPFYVFPHKRYTYEPPSWASAETTSPFMSGWFVWLPTSISRPAMSSRVDLFLDVDAISSDYRDVTDPKKKRPNPRARKKQKARRAIKASLYAGARTQPR